MTVASLWKALDRAGCGKCIGASELLDHHGTKSKTNPWNLREMNQLSREKPVLAIDLSIWICEALASSNMNHVADPALQLVYSRALKLLTLGIKLVAVVEGKRRNRIRHQDNATGNSTTQDKFRKRRSGTLFWTACERCERLLKLLGVIVVRAKAEGEALCALLNQRGIVDGVISNDGDCLLFGAKVLYTKFSVENLDRSKVLRYDANTIRVVVDDDDADRFDDTRPTSSKHGEEELVKLSRKDLIAFAILTGSDLAGEGLSNVGCRKAIRFIRKCQIDNPLKLDEKSSPALDQLLSWEHAAVTRGNFENEEFASGPRCSCCGHPGTKRDHKKFGCKGCGTEPGEPCFQLSPGGRFRRQLRAKALSMQSSFDPSSTLRAYYEPNENQIPLCLLGKTARKVEMNPPQPQKLLELPFLIRGRSLGESREYVQKSLSVYLARQELLEVMVSNKEGGDTSTTKLPRNRNRPTPLRVSKFIVRNGKPSCEVQWVIKATTSDAEGNPLDEYEFSTIEDESVIQKCHPKLLQEFREEQTKLQQQGTTEQEKRRNFLLSMDKTPQDVNAEMQPNGAKKSSRTRKDYFDQSQIGCILKPLAKRKGMSDDVEAILIPTSKPEDGQKDQLKESTKNDVHIGREISIEIDAFEKYCPPEQGLRRPRMEQARGDNCERHEVLDDSSTIYTVSLLQIDKSMALPNQDYSFRNALTPGHEYYLGIESAFQFRSMAGDDFHPGICSTVASFLGNKSGLLAESHQAKQEKPRALREEAYSGKYGLEGRMREGFSFAQISDNEASCLESNNARPPSTSAVLDDFFRPVEEKLNLVIETEQKDRSRKRLEDRVVKNEIHNGDSWIHHRQAVIQKHCPRAKVFMSNIDCSSQIQDRDEPCHHPDLTRLGSSEFGFCPFCFPDNERIKGIKGVVERRPVGPLNLESSRRFDSDNRQVGRYDLRGTRMCEDQFQSKSRHFSYESYDIPRRKRETKQRKRSRDQQAKGCGCCVESHQKQWVTDYSNDDSATSFSWHRRQEDGFCCANENGNASKQRKISRSKVLHEQSQSSKREQRCSRHHKEVYHSGIRIEGEDESNFRESRCLQCNKRDGLHRDKYKLKYINRSKSFNVQSPLKFDSGFEYRKHDENFSFCPSFEAYQDECIPVEILDQEIDQPVIAWRAGQCGSFSCRSKRGYCQCQSNFTGTSSPDYEMETVERIEIEKRIAAKREARNRRAQFRFLFSKYCIDE